MENLQGSKGDAGPAAREAVPADSQAEQRRDTARRRCLRWWPVVVILAAGAVAETFVWLRFSADSTQRVFYSMPILSGTAFLLLLWWVFASGVDWGVRVRGLLALVALGLVARFTLRIDGFEGDMMPRISFRWQPTPEERAAEYWRRLEAAASDRAATASTVSASPSEGTSGSGGESGSARTSGRSAVAATGDGSATTGAVPSSAGPLDWPEFRGAGRAGVVENTQLDWDWDVRPPRELWRHPVGLGWSSFAAVGGLCWTLEQRGEFEAVVCYELASGRQIWAHRDRARFEEPLGGPGPRTTPTFHRGRLYTLGATGILNCLRADNGERLWSRNILEDAGAKNLPWGMAGSPLYWDGRVIVNPGRGGGKAVIAYDAQTGDIVWAEGNRVAAYASPQRGRLGGRQCLLIFGGEGLQVHDPDTGRERWFFPWSNDPKINAAQPVVLPGDRVFVSCSYGVGGACAVLNEDRLVELWRVPTMKLKFNSAVLCGDVIYGLSERILTALDARSGEVLWKSGRYGYGQMLLVEHSAAAPDAGLLLIQAETGEVALVEVTRERMTERYRLPALNDKTWNHPAVADRYLLLRNGVEAVCYELPSRESAEDP